MKLYEFETPIFLFL